MAIRKNRRCHCRRMGGMEILKKEITYERGINGSYMILPVGAVQRKGYAKRMILENRIRGFLPVTYRLGEEGEAYEYQVSALISLAEYLEHHWLKARLLKQWVFALCQAVTEMGEYLLTEDHLWLTPETIFLRESEEAALEGDFYFCLYPEEDQDRKEQLRQLLKYLMERTDPTDETCALLCYELYGLVQKENFCLQEFMEALERWARPEVPQEPKKDTEKKKQKKKRSKQLFASGKNSGIMKLVRS